MGRTELKNKADVYRIGREAFFSEDATNFIKKLYRSLKPRVNKLHKKKGLRVNFDWLYAYFYTNFNFLLL